MAYQAIAPSADSLPPQLGVVGRKRGGGGGGGAEAAEAM
jgi:hypothetical protein